MKFERSLASVLLLRPNSSASFVRRELVSAVGSGAGTFFFFCITQKKKIDLPYMWKSLWKTILGFNYSNKNYLPD